MILIKMDILTNKLKQLMADCNKIVADNNIKDKSYEIINNLLKNFVSTNDNIILSKINLLQKIEDERPKRNQKVPQITNEATKSNSTKEILKKIRNNNNILNNHVIDDEINKYHLKQVDFDGKRHFNKLYCILVPKYVSKYKIYKYIESLLKLKKNVNIRVSEQESNFYMIKYSISKSRILKTPRRFEPRNCEHEVIKEKRIFTIEDKHNYFSSQFNQTSYDVNNSKTSEYMGKLLSGDNTNETKTILEIMLRQNFINLKMKYINEFNCNLMISMILFAFSKTQTNSFVYSLEKSMKVGQIIRRCDGLYIHQPILIIFEFKNNAYKKECPLEYIDKRDYAEFVIRYFQKYEPHILNKITTIRRIGIEFFGKNKDYKVIVSIQENIQLVDFISSQEEEPKFLGKFRKRKINQSS
jgi:hypothetical protein